MTRILDEPVFWIDPSDIKRSTSLTQAECMTFGVKIKSPEFYGARNRVREAGHLLGGDWDINPPLFSREKFFDVLRAWDRCGDATKTESWMQSVKRHGERRTVAMFDRWRLIYADMKRNGYRQNADLPWNEYVLLAVGRDGELHHYQGRHRMAMAIALGIDSIPVKVGIRHSEWWAFVREVRAYAAAHKGRIYSPIRHPDFDQFNRAWSDLRGNLILQHINPETKTVLDIGAHWGYFSCLLADTGRRCTAVELAPDLFRFLSKINRVHRDKVHVVNGSINYFLAGHSGRFDCVLALNIFHHFLKDRNRWENLQAVVSNLDCREMFFQMATDESLGKFGGGWKKTADVLQLLRDRAGLGILQPIGEENGRVLYHLRKGKP